MAGRGDRVDGVRVQVFHEMNAKQAEGANVPHDGVLFSYDLAKQLALDAVT